ncbi:MAG TPA: polyamine aminopropyltransferase, partial [Burkholderiales bacterium]|nr:polyamine aminopropyltransferase [Burkholderiales bacterium]
MRFGRKIFRSVREEEIEVSESSGVRTLHLGTSAIQSAMRLSRPDSLELAYTRAMMAFLLFHPEPEEILMIGLGGGSLAKFVHRHMMRTRTVAVEINPKIVSVARNLFYLPDDDERLEVVVDDGARYLPGKTSCADVIMIDAYDGHFQPDALTGTAFYAYARDALKDGGMLVVNLWGSDKKFSTYLSRIEKAFDGLTLCLPAEKHSNIIVFGFRNFTGNPAWLELREEARMLSSLYGMDFMNFLEGLKKMNHHTEKRLV